MLSTKELQKKLNELNITNLNDVLFFIHLYKKYPVYDTIEQRMKFYNNAIANGLPYVI